MSDYIIRHAKTDSDLTFVVKSWLSSYRTSKSNGLLSLEPLSVHCPTCHEAIGYDYESVMNYVIRRILARPGVQILLAANPRERPPLDLHGFVIVEEGANVPTYRPPRYQLEVQTATVPLVHYVYVKKIYRGLGLARALFAKAGVDPQQRFLYTCSTPLSVQIEKAHKVPLAEWTPACVRFAKETGKIHDQGTEAAPLQPPGADSDSLQPTRRHLPVGR